MTQREFVIDLLRRAGPRGVCSFEAYRHGPHAFNSRNRVSELNAEGWEITSEQCRHDEQTPSHVRWTLKREPAPEQLALA